MVLSQAFYQILYYKEAKNTKHFFNLCNWFQVIPHPELDSGSPACPRGIAGQARNDVCYNPIAQLAFYDKFFQFITVKRLTGLFFWIICDIMMQKWHIKIIMVWQFVP